MEIGIHTNAGPVAAYPQAAPTAANEQVQTASAPARAQDEVVLSAEAQAVMETAEDFTPPTGQEFLSGILSQPRGKNAAEIPGVLTFCEPKSTAARPRINGTEFKGENFTDQELRAAQKFLTDLGEAFYKNGVTGGTLDYEDYAALGMGEGYVRAFGKEQGLSEQKISALVDFYQAKTKEIVEQNLAQLPLDRQATHLENSKYFLGFRDEAKTIAGRCLPEGSLATYPDAAVNWSLIRSVYDTMASADRTDPASVSRALASFQKSAMEARSVHSLGQGSWLNHRVGLYMEKLGKVESAVDALLARAS